MAMTGLNKLKSDESSLTIIVVLLLCVTHQTDLEVAHCLQEFSDVPSNGVNLGVP